MVPLPLKKKQKKDKGEMEIQPLALKISSGAAKEKVQIWGQMKQGSDADGIN